MPVHLFGTFRCHIRHFEKTCSGKPGKDRTLIGEAEMQQVYQLLAHAGLQHCMRRSGYSLHPCFFSVRFGRTMD